MTELELERKQIEEEKKFYHKYWKHYIALERRVFDTERFVTIAENNYRTYSIEYDILIQAICSEIDVVAKRLCKEFDKTSSADDMSAYINNFLKFDSSISKEKVNLDFYDLSFIPWKQISTTRELNGETVHNCPNFWNCYNKIKHDRIIETKTNNVFTEERRNIEEANLKNVLNSLAALYILEKKCIENLRNRFSNLFKEINSPLECGIEFPEKSIFEQEIISYSAF